MDSGLQVHKDFYNSKWEKVEWNVLAETQHIVCMCVCVITLITLILS